MRGKCETHCGNKKNKFQAVTSNGSRMKQLRGNKKLTSPFVTKQKGYMNTNGAKEYLNERH